MDEERYRWALGVLEKTCKYCYKGHNLVCGEPDCYLVVCKEALKKRIGVPPVWKAHPKHKVGIYRCGVCGARIRSGYGTHEKVQDTVCNRCHQAVDWSEEDERRRKQTD